MAIEFFAEDIDFPAYEESFLQTFITRLITSKNNEVGEISYIFCSDVYLLKINIDYLQHDYYTDIITFDYVEGNLISGDVFLSIDRVKDNAEVLNVGFDSEFARVLSHGILHLLGFKDKTDDEAAEMRLEEDKAIVIFNEVKVEMSL
ncbi:rRNA maturation RNase YbeY [Halosquirtibacter xylanolyticus]|uniref:rRNA maturation RNase YbeY n=1 Tax=Halosquirtibacter xylanolyticus TaxID=3374599 RepID=UPI00374A974D|nr:rRNA maturation RNase YbeY [Prolixibacteraceae bacterium]